MNYYNTDTKRIETLSYIMNGSDCLPDICESNLGSGKLVTIGGYTYCQASSKDIDFWVAYIKNDERATDLKLECQEKGLNDDELYAILNDAWGKDMGVQPLRMIQLFEEFLER